MILSIAKKISNESSNPLTSIAVISFNFADTIIVYIYKCVKTVHR